MGQEILWIENMLEIIMDNFKGTSGSFLNNKILLRYSYFIRNNNKKYAFSNILKAYLLSR